MAKRDKRSTSGGPADDGAVLGEEVFVAVCIDRHLDERITVHRSRAGADAAVDAFIAEYGLDPNDTGAWPPSAPGDGNRYEWQERDLSGLTDDYAHLVRAVDTEDDGPHARIELLVLEP